MVDGELPGNHLKIKKKRIIETESCLLFFYIFSPLQWITQNIHLFSYIFFPKAGLVRSHRRLFCRPVTGVWTFTKKKLHQKDMLSSFVLVCLFVSSFPFARQLHFCMVICENVQISLSLGLHC